MIPGTTPTFMYILDDVQEAQDVVNARIDVTQQKTGAEVQKYYSKGEVQIDTVAGTMSTTLTQQESLQFEKGKAETQLHVLYRNGAAYKTEAESFKVEKSITDDELKRS